MKRQISGILTLIAIVLVIGGAVLCSRFSPSHKHKPSAVSLQAGLVRTSVPRRMDFSVTCRWFGTVESRDTVKIVALEAGRVISVDAEDGTAVRKGTSLFTIGGPMVASRLKALRKKLGFLNERVALARRNVALKREALKEKLVDGGKVSAAENALVRLKSEREIARQQLRSFQSAVCVRAPIDGVFTNRSVSVGQDVEKGAKLAEVIVPGQVRVVASLFPPSSAPLEGKTAIIHTSDKTSLSGTVTRVFPRRTPEGAAVIWIEGNDVDGHLDPGETVSGEIVLLVHRDALAVPASAIVRDEHEQAFVFVKKAGGYRKQPVQTGTTSGKWVEIAGGIKEGNEVVVRGAYELFYRDFNKVFKVAD